MTRVQVKGQNEVIRVSTVVVLLLLGLDESTRDFQMNINTMINGHIRTCFPE